MSGSFAVLVVEALVASTMLLLLVLALRGPVRRAFGPGVAYALWALPALRLVLPPMPADWSAWPGGVAQPVATMGRQAMVLMVADPVPLSAGVAQVAAVPSGGGTAAIVALLWAAGVAGFVVWQAVRYRAFRRRVLALAQGEQRIGSVRVVESAGADGPLAFGVIDRVIAFPHGFDDLYDGQERALALAHEMGHHARGDLIANWLALLVLALHWFNPVAWIAFRAFRADQEMANDAGVLARCGEDARHAYGCAIVKAAHGRAVSAACHLHAVDDLKGRLRMLGRGRLSRRRIGFGAMMTGAAGLGALALTASGTEAAQRVRDRVEHATGVDLAALDAVKAFQSATPDVPATPGQPDAAGAAAPATARRVTRGVVVIKDGHTTTYEGAAADAYVAANPPPAPPAPPTPPAPPATVADAATARPRLSASVPPAPPVPDVTERNCIDGRDGSRSETVVSRRDGGRQVTIICTNRIERMASDAAARAVDAGRIQRDAMRTALASLLRTRASLSTQRGLSEEQRRDALAGLDDAIAEMKTEANDRD